MVKNLHKLTEPGKRWAWDLESFLLKSLGPSSLFTLFSLLSRAEKKVSSSHELQLETFLSLGSDWPYWVICLSLGQSLMSKGPVMEN